MSSIYLVDDLFIITKNMQVIWLIFNVYLQWDRNMITGNKNKKKNNKIVKRLKLNTDLVGLDDQHLL